jgi:catechol 2,3-dioxygenase-like lactoylglutathione lyase family enzyme
MIEIEPASRPGQHEFDSGISHLAFTVADLESLCNHLQGEGVKFLLPPSQFRPDRKIAFIEDPDGIRIQLIQFLQL